MRSSDDAQRPRGTRVWLRSLGFVLMPMMSLLIFSVIFEVGLRIRPRLIPPKLLLQFEPAMRAELAKGRFDTKAAAYPSAKLKKRDQENQADFRYRLVDGDQAVEFNPHNSDRDEILFARRLVSGEIEATLFDGALERFSSLAISHDFLPVLAYSPSAHTAYRAHVVFEDESNRELLEVYNRMLRSYLSARASDLGLVFVDLTEPFMEAAEEIELDRLYYYPTSMHFTARAHALVAEVLAEALESKPDLASDSPQLRLRTSPQGALLE